MKNKDVSSQDHKVKDYDNGLIDRQPRLRAHRRMRELMLTGTAAGIGLSATLCGVACDPAPPPVWTCSDSTITLWKRGLSGSAIWQQNGMQSSIAVQLYLDRSIERMATVKFSGNPILSGAKIGLATIDTAQAYFTCVPDTSVQLIAVSMPLKCDDGTPSLNFILDLGTGNKNVPVSIRPIP